MAQPQRWLNWTAFEVKEWMINYTPLFYMDTIIPPCPNPSLDALYC